VPRVLVVGSANVDFTVAVPRLPRPGETVTEGTLLIARGGKGANQAVAARRLGAEVRLVGCVGDDASGRQVRQALATEGIGVQALRSTAAAATGTALIAVDAAGRNQIVVAPGANRALTTADVDDADLAWADIVVCSLEVPLPVVRHALERARAVGARTVLNPAPFPDGGVDFLHLADYATPNEGEAARLGGRAADVVEDGVALAEAVRARGARHAIVTLGERGVVADGPEGRLHVPAFAITAVDTTGAGDAFNGALAVAVAERRPLSAALRFASAAAAVACTRRGAQPAMPTRAEVETLADS
jgi:ribokinase